MSPGRSSPVRPDTSTQPIAGEHPHLQCHLRAAGSVHGEQPAGVPWPCVRHGLAGARPHADSSRWLQSSHSTETELHSGHTASCLLPGDESNPEALRLLNSSGGQTSKPRQPSRLQEASRSFCMPPHPTATHSSLRCTLVAS